MRPHRDRIFSIYFLLAFKSGSTVDCGKKMLFTGKALSVKENPEDFRENVLEKTLKGTTH